MFQVMEGLPVTHLMLSYCHAFFQTTAFFHNNLFLSSVNILSFLKAKPKFHTYSSWNLFWKLPVDIFFLSPITFHTSLSVTLSWLITFYFGVCACVSLFLSDCRLPELVNRPFSEFFSLVSQHLEQRLAQVNVWKIEWLVNEYVSEGILEWRNKMHDEGGTSDFSAKPLYSKKLPPFTTFACPGAHHPHLPGN